MFIQGIDVLLYETTQIGVDDFDAPIYDPNPTTVKNVLIIQPKSEEIAEQLNLTGKKVLYTLCIPKGDVHDWENKEVEFFGQRFVTVGKTTQYIEELTPLSWNKQIKVAAYE